MTHTLSLPDEVYQRIKAYAAARGQTAEEAVAAWAASIAQPSQEPAEAAYNPADDPLAEFLGMGELTDPEAIRRHDEVFADIVP
ncbi:MAG TPA: hypothetical protein VFU88_12675 [Ktedonobacterales bacterium]|nr:hypothetical protein [Ktedonobacterales bacterium]